MLVRLRLALQRALLGNVSQHLVAVTAGIEGRSVRLIAYFDRPPTDVDRQLLWDIGGEVIADFEQGFTIEESAELWSPTARMLAFWAFYRDTDLSSQG